jgi:serine phosphatase RsbU (regulator of sigma subunit)
VRDRLLVLAESLRARRWLTLLLALAIQVAVLVPLGSLLPARHILGLPGSLIALIAVMTGALGGPLLGFLSATGGAVVFFFAIAEQGERSSGPTVLVAAALWALAGVVSGLIADASRRNSQARHELTVSLTAEEAAGRAQEERAQLAASLTASLLPRLPVDHPRLEVFSLYRPGEQRLGLGGDFMDACSLPDGSLTAIIGDVAGHGPAAAALGAGLRAGWRSLVMSGVTHGSLMDTLNALVLGEERPEVFVTACLAWIDPSAGQATFVSAGHPKPLLLAEQLRRIEVPTSLPLGVEEKVGWRPGRLALPRRWTIVLYTDGLVEGRAWPSGVERYGERRLMAYLSDGERSRLDQAALLRLLSEIEQANGAALPDDVAALVVASRGE